ncbi:hypothetical protein SDC9_197202 [bioreactor metagenome]|uniref:Uncharacterized protein n=1 Tax=bioreactor metagenome TaxID=1076179 RepID=A0A645IEM4_9ZZZZ
MHIGPFDKAVVGDHGVEFGVRDEVILTAMFFLAARRARGVRDGGVDACVEFAQSAYQRGFAGTAGCRHDK